jgi:hypothetical protein
MFVLSLFFILCQSNDFMFCPLSRFEETGKVLCRGEHRLMLPVKVFSKTIFSEGRLQWINQHIPWMPEFAFSN